MSRKPVIRRREFLEAAGTLGLVASVQCGGGGGEPTPRARPREATPGAPPSSPFRHGVASGDPLADRVILWTRVSPPTPHSPAIPVTWFVADGPDPTRANVLARGEASATAGRDHTVKVDAAGLTPGRTFHYWFEAQGHRSPIGRTRTLMDGRLASAKLAFTSCSNITFGHFNVYAAMAQRDDLDAVLHLGDYIYEYPDGVYGDGAAIGRGPEPNRELVSLADYRTRYAQYRRDPDLQEVHRQHPFIAVWDDHESANNAWRDGALNHQPELEGEWRARKANAIRAYFEWLPVREQTAAGRLYRSFRFGDLLDLMMLDARLEGRSEQLAYGVPPTPAQLADPRRSMLGEEQERWLFNELTASQRDRVTWRVLGQQIVMAHRRDDDGSIPNTDMWSGYPVARERLLGHVAERGIDNLVVLAGDIHSSWAFELALDPYAKDAARRRPLGVELVTPAVTSPSWVPPGEEVATEAAMMRAHPHLRWVELAHRGYVELDITRSRLRATWRFVDTLARRTPDTRVARVLDVMSGDPRLIAQDV